jgi:hypothetical protein
MISGWAVVVSGKKQVRQTDVGAKEGGIWNAELAS